MVVTGGGITGIGYYVTVERYDHTGLKETLPDLNIARWHHGCAKYQVRLSVILLKDLIRHSFTELSGREGGIIIIRLYGDS